MDTNNRQRSKFGAALFLMVLAVALVPRQIYGHSGGEPAVSDVAVGPFVLYLWLDPVPAVVGEQHVTVSVNAPGNGNDEATTPVLGADVTVTAISASDPDGKVIAEATHDQAANKLFYEARLDIPTAGSWQLLIKISSGLDTATFEYTLEVEETDSPRTETLWGKFIGWLRDLFPKT